MVIDPDTIAAYAPHGNAELSFEVGSVGGPLTPVKDPETGNYILAPVIDPHTGNYTEPFEKLEYLAAGNLEAPNWKPQEGVDSTTYGFRGRLLSPSRLDPRLTSGMQGEATINGVKGRFELVFDLAQLHSPVVNNDTRQSILGKFVVIGGHG